MTNIGEHFYFFAELADLFKARFMMPLWVRYPARDSDSFDALCLFLDGYAFARQGAKPDFAHVAIDVVNELKTQARSLIATGTPPLVWKMFCTRLQYKDLNEANNPLCPVGTNYTRKTGQSKTYGDSVFEFLRSLDDNHIAPNIVSFARNSIQLDMVRDAHRSLCEINGVGAKIASLFLRDVAEFYAVFPSTERNLLQPVDVWIKRIMSYLCNHDLSNEEVQELIIKQAFINNICPETVNGGMWYFGSEIADSQYRMQRALDDLGYAKVLIKKHIDAVREELLAWERKQLNGN